MHSAAILYTFYDLFHEYAVKKSSYQSYCEANIENAAFAIGILWQWSVKSGVLKLPVFIKGEQTVQSPAMFTNRTDILEAPRYLRRIESASR